MWVAIREADFTDGRLPSVCVKTGARADRVLVMYLRSLPRWTYLLLLCGVVPFVIVWAFTRSTSRGVVPIADEPLQRIRRARATAVALFVLAMVLLVGGARVAALGFASLLALLAVLVVLLVWIPLLGIRGAIVVDERHPGRVIVLSRVHPAFRRAVEDMGRALGSGE
jgi:O-antigen ligase